MSKKWRLAVVAIFVLALAATLYVLDQHTYEMSEQEIAIDTAQGRLTGKLVLPASLPEDHAGTLGLVVFVHGDGPINASYNDGYKPLWEKLAAAGYASLSLSKPGVDGSEGNWLAQSMEDRAQEVVAAIAWAKDNLPMIDPSRIGLWGASQAGWVMPKVAAHLPDLAFTIAVSPAINWVTQGKYNTRAEMMREGRSQEEIEAWEAYDDRVLQLLLAQGDYDAYLRIAREDSRIEADRWSFIRQNVLEDATAELSRFRSPVLLVLGGQDVHVDVAETERIYRQQIAPGLLSVSYLPDADHSMVGKALAASPWKTYLYGVFLPRRLCVPQYYLDVVAFLEHLA